MEVLIKEIDKIENRHKELRDIFSKSQLSNEELKKLAKEHSSLEGILPKIKEYRKVLKEVDEARSVLSATKDSEMIAFAKQELDELAKAKDALEDDIRFFISAPAGLGKNVFVEIRAGAGGDEAALFASDPFLPNFTISAQGHRSTRYSASSYSRSPGLVKFTPRSICFFTARLTAG